MHWDSIKLIHQYARRIIDLGARSRHFIDRMRLQIASQPIFWTNQNPVIQPNTFFDRRELKALWGYIQRMAYKDRYLLLRLSEARIQGIRAWEYGRLLAILHDHPEHKSWQVLDIGPGNSTFPVFLSSCVGNVVTIDYPNPLEPPSPENRQRWRQADILSTQGTMLRLPFQSRTFDLGICISTIEHLDDPGTGEQRSYAQFVDMTHIGLREMLRVIRPGGYLYLTTDAYIPELQMTDNWSKKRHGDKIWSAYHIQDIESIFVNTIIGGGFDLIGGCDYNPALLIRDTSRSTFRGRYFTTFCVYARCLK